jgi:hypothetical protein
LKFNPDHAWRWVLRLAGLAGIFIGARAEPPYPQVVFIIFAAMIGLDFFIERKNGRKNGAD